MVVETSTSKAGPSSAPSQAAAPRRTTSRPSDSPARKQAAEGGPRSATSSQRTAILIPTSSTASQEQGIDHTNLNGKTKSSDSDVASASTRLYESPQKTTTTSAESLPLRDESTSTDHRAALASRIGFEPRSISGLPDPALRTNEAIVWLDIDNTLYKRSTKIADLMAERIRAYFHGMGLSQEEAKTLHTTYYKTYGLAIRGLVKHHQIDPLDYDRKCDASLPLEDVLQPDHRVKRLLTDIDRTRARVFALTNAYKHHADRVLRLLDLEDQVEGIVYCDYAVPDFACKPELDYYRAALLVVGVEPGTRHYFVDDSSLNVVAAKELGWHSCIYFREEDDPLPSPPAASDSDQKAAASFSTVALQPIAGSNGAFDEQAIRRRFQDMPAHLRIQLLRIILDACLPGDIAAMSKTLEKQLRLTRDVVSGLPDQIALKILEKLPLQDLLRCRHVSKKWHSLAATPKLWRSHAIALTESDPVKLVAPSDPEGWEPLVKGLFFRERNWANGLAQNIQKLEGHAGFVTAMKLKGRKTLVSGSYDETIRVWDISTGICRKVLRAKAIACLDFLLDEGVLCAGLYDTGRVLVWDMKSWDLIQTLSGHNRGIRNVAINERYLVSVGQDKAIVVWDWRTGIKVVRFGQQSNVSLGVSLVDKDKLVAVTVDGMIRCFSIPRREMIGQFQLSKLGGTELGLSARLGELSSGSSMLEWFAAHGNTMTIASKSVVVHLEWQECVVPLQESQTPLTAEGLRRNASSRLSSVGGVAGSALSPHRNRRDSTMSNASATAASASVGTPARSRRDSNTSISSSTSGLGQARSPRRPIAGASSTPNATPSRAGRVSMGTFDSPPISSLSTPSRPSPRTATKGVTGPTPWPLASTENEPATRAPGPPTRRRISTSTATPSLSFPSPHVKEADDAPPDASAYEVNGKADSGSGSSCNATRIAPDLSTAPKVVSILETPDVAVGCVDPTKRRIVASTRFSSRAGAERKLFASSLPLDHGSTSTQLAAPTSSAKASDAALDVTVPIAGAWAAQSADLATPARNPMTMELDHESVVVGCADGLIYRIHFVGSEYGRVTETAPAAGLLNGAEEEGGGGGVGDATITDLLQLREVWSEIMVPEGEKDHPGRLKRDRVMEMGLK